MNNKPIQPFSGKIVIFGSVDDVIPEYPVMKRALELQEKKDLARELSEEALADAVMAAQRVKDAKRSRLQSFEIPQKSEWYEFWPHESLLIPISRCKAQFVSVAGEKRTLLLAFDFSNGIEIKIACKKCGPDRAETLHWLYTEWTGLHLHSNEFRCKCCEDLPLPEPCEPKSLVHERVENTKFENTKFEQARAEFPQLHGPGYRFQASDWVAVVQNLRFFPYVRQKSTGLVHQLPDDATGMPIGYEPYAPRAGDWWNTFFGEACLLSPANTEMTSWYVNVTCKSGEFCPGLVGLHAKTSSPIVGRDPVPMPLVPTRTQPRDDRKVSQAAAIRAKRRETLARQEEKREARHQQSMARRRLRPLKPSDIEDQPFPEGTLIRMVDDHDCGKKGSVHRSLGRELIDGYGDFVLAFESASKSNHPWYRPEDSFVKWEPRVGDYVQEVGKTGMESVWWLGKHISPNASFWTINQNVTGVAKSRPICGMISAANRYTPLTPHLGVTPKIYAMGVLEFYRENSSGKVAAFSRGTCVYAGSGSEGYHCMDLANEKDKADIGEFLERIKELRIEY